MTQAIRPCWTRAEIQAATQIDVGSLEFGDPVADAVFAAVHQPMPIARRSLAGASALVEVTEQEVLRDLCEPLAANEPHLRFVTGTAGSGKSHLVRWLRSSIPHNPKWHLVYIEKRNTSLPRIIEKILAGIHTPSVDRLREGLRSASSALSSRDEAKLALLNKLHQLIAHGHALDIDGVGTDEVAELQPFVSRLVGDYTFKQQLMKSDGPVARITDLAFLGHQEGEDIKPGDLVFGQTDLRVDLEEFLEAEPEVLSKVRTLVATARIRAVAAAILNYYLPRAKAEVFTGQSTDLVEVFCDVRRELATQGKELFLFVEDLVTLDGIDMPLAQALTVPASREMCRIRAVIAVTSGHLEKYTTFEDRGVHYTMDLGRSAFDDEDLRDLVARYLNVGRLGRTRLVAETTALGDEPNGCVGCPVQERCHNTFGASRQGHGFFPFNATALDRLVNLASPDGFNPRDILREVIRSPLEVAEEELDQPGQFPSARLAAAFPQARSSVPLPMRDSLKRRAASPEQETTLRALYARDAPAVDEELREIAEVFGVRLTDLAEQEPTPSSPLPTMVTSVPQHSPIEAWITSGTPLPSEPARTVRSWILDAIYACLQDGPFGVPVKRTKERAANELIVGPVRIPLTAIVIDNSAGSGGARSAYNGPTMRFAADDHDGVLLEGILRAERDAGDLAGPNGGRWLLEVQRRVAQFASDIARHAAHQADEDPLPALQILGVLSSPYASEIRSSSEALEVMLRGGVPGEVSQAVRGFLEKSSGHRRAALSYLRDRYAARKGTGAWSLFDAGALLRQLTASAMLRELPQSIAETHPELGRDLRSMRDMQDSASREAWRPLSEELDRLRALIGDDSDQLGTAELMDEFVRNAHQASILGAADAASQYRELRSRATAQAFSTHAHLAKLAGEEPSAAHLWELAADSLAVLRDLRAYWTRCQQLLDQARLNPPASLSDADAFDRARLQHAFRALAAALEESNGA